ncbi:unnamed protein product [Brachionus calyciflorus]|uniref:ISXO2-like transposase domain-containing protein n=1 Tax=Brachionus calyciflorus TaxID=104777 RepID=A0A814P503_9BILA|nr:unnamed protein product [Brachionus calyciflorus]
MSEKKPLIEKEIFTINQLSEYKVIQKSTICFNCNKKNFTLFDRKESDSKKFLLTWRCSCGQYKAIRDGSFFSMYKTPLSELILFIRFWAVQISISKSIDLFKQMTGQTITRKIVGLLYLRLRNICTRALDKKNIRIGGQGHIVEIDKSMVARVKHNVGKDLARAQVWMFGMICRSDDLCYIEIVPDRTQYTLLRICYDHIKPESIIFSDTWSSYSKLSEVNNYTHEQVNHKYNFVSPTNSNVH